MMSKTIWIINNYASHLESRHFELAKQFAEHGYKVAIITSSYHHGKKAYLSNDEFYYNKISETIYSFYLRALPAYKTNGAKRVANMIDFCRLVWKYRRDIAKTIGKPNYIIGSSAHPFVWEVSYALSKKYNAKFIAEFRDIWPLSLVEIQGTSKNHPFVVLLSAIERRAYRRANAIVGTMPFADKHVCDDLGFSRSKYYWMPNGINTDKVEALLMEGQTLPDDLEIYLTSHKCCVYVGSIVKSECIDYILDAWKKVRDNNLFFAIIGEGGEKEHVLKRIDNEAIENVKVFDAVLPTEVPIVLQKSFCCVAALEFGELGRFGLSKYKLNDYLYSGKPTIFACDSPNVVKEAGHFSIPIGDPEQLALAIENVSSMETDDLLLLGEKGKSYIKRYYDYKVIGNNYVKMLESL